MLLATRIVIMHAHPRRIVEVFPNPFAQRSPTTSITSLCLSSEFIQPCQTLIESIRTDRKQESESIKTLHQNRSVSGGGAPAPGLLINKFLAASF